MTREEILSRYQEHIRHKNWADVDEFVLELAFLIDTLNARIVSAMVQGIPAYKPPLILGASNNTSDLSDSLTP